jgi:hypothetical protein
MLVTVQNNFEKTYWDGLSPSGVVAATINSIENAAQFAAKELHDKSLTDVVTLSDSRLSKGGKVLTASLVVLTERQAYTIALSQRFAPFNAEAQTLEELRANAKRYAPDLLKMLTGE